MANRLYDRGREAFLGPASGQVNWLNDTIKVVLCTSAYTPNTAADQYLSDVPGGSQVATSSALTGKTITAGVADADDVTFSAVAGGSTVTQAVVYKDTGVAATSPLIALLDTAVGFPITTNGNDITLLFDNSTYRIFKL
jgi:hypothetical protein